MPELPEVETLKRQLEKAVRGQVIEEIKVLRRKSFVGSKRKALGGKITGLDRKAKHLIIEIEGIPKRYLVIHLKMTGQLIYDGPKKKVVGGHPSADWVKKLPSKHTRVILTLSKGVLYFNDMRVFGWIKVMTAPELKRLKAKMPPDVVDKEFSGKYLIKVLTNSRRSVKQIIMDPTKIGGVGNIYANDALYCAGIDPRTTGITLSSQEKRAYKLFICLKRVIGRGIKYHGASDSSYVHLDGMGGKYQEHFLIYKKHGQKCTKCGTKIRRIKLGGRGTFFCPSCQP